MGEVIFRCALMAFPVQEHPGEVIQTIEQTNGRLFHEVASDVW